MERSSRQPVGYDPAYRKSSPEGVSAGAAGGAGYGYGWSIRIWPMLQTPSGPTHLGYINQPLPVISTSPGSILICCIYVLCPNVFMFLCDDFYIELHGMLDRALCGGSPLHAELGPSRNSTQTNVKRTCMTAQRFVADDWPLVAQRAWLSAHFEKSCA